MSAEQFPMQVKYVQNIQKTEQHIILSRLSSVHHCFFVFVALTAVEVSLVSPSDRDM